MTWGGATARRLQRHGLTTPLAGAQAADAAAAMCGAHAQILSAAELSIGLRLEGVTRAHVRDALWQDHSLIKTFGPRGTVHLLPARDLAMWTGALGALPRGASSFSEHVRLTPEQTDAVVVAIGDALEDAELTIDELGEAVVARAGSWAGDLVMPAFQTHWPRWRQVGRSGGDPGRALLRPQPRAKRHLHQPRPLAARFPPGGRGCRARLAAPVLPSRLRPGHSARFRPMAGGIAHSGRASSSLSAPLSWNRSRSTARAPGWWPGTRRFRTIRPGVCGCCPTSMRSSSAATRVPSLFLGAGGARGPGRQPGR